MPHVTQSALGMQGIIFEHVAAWRQGEPDEPLQGSITLQGGCICPAITVHKVTATSLKTATNSSYMSDKLQLLMLSGPAQAANIQL